MPKARSTKRKARARTRKPAAATPPKVFLSHASEDKDRKPPVGAGPAFSNKPTVGLGDLTRADSLVLQSACEACLARSQNLSLHLTGQELLQRTGTLGIPSDAVWESLQVLESRGYADSDPWIRAAPQGGSLQVTFAGFELYLKGHRPEYGKLLRQFASQVVNKEAWERKTIAQAMRLPEVELDHIVTVFEKKKWIVVAHFGGGNWKIAEGGVSPELKRWLDSPEEFLSLP